MVVRLLHEFFSENLCHRFVERSLISEYGKRNHSDLRIPTVGLEHAARNAYVSGIKNWNDVPDNIQKQVAFAHFKRSFRKHVPSEPTRPKHGNLVEFWLRTKNSQI